MVAVGGLRGLKEGVCGLRVDEESAVVVRQGIGFGLGSGSDSDVVEQGGEGGSDWCCGQKPFVFVTGSGSNSDSEPESLVSAGGGL